MSNCILTIKNKTINFCKADDLCDRLKTDIVLNKVMYNYFNIVCTVHYVI